MQTRRYTRLPGMTLAVMLTLLIGQAPVFGHDDGDRTEPSKLEGTWDVTLTFEPAPPTGCVGMGPIPTLNTFLKQGGMLWSGGRLTAGPGQGSWKRLGHNHFMARFKFFTFDLTTGSRTGSEELTKDIHLTGPDTFEATTTFDFFDASGTLGPTGCIIKETATRFE